jgi:hypothetical protein
LIPFGLPPIPGIGSPIITEGLLDVFIFLLTLKKTIHTISSKNMTKGGDKLVLLQTAEALGWKLMRLVFDW